VVALDDVDVGFQRQATMIVGSGKSTLMHRLAGSTR
jgi:ABC-type lipoprotein export system ATPase subunit